MGTVMLRELAANWSFYPTRQHLTVPALVVQLPSLIRSGVCEDLDSLLAPASFRHDQDIFGATWRAARSS